MNMIEKVARAIDAAGQKDTLETYGIKNAAMCFDEIGSEENRKLMLLLAKAAIAAMREPSEEMLKVPFETTPDKYYQDVIDAALKE